MISLTVTIKIESAINLTYLHIKHSSKSSPKYFRSTAYLRFYFTRVYVNKWGVGPKVN